MAKDFRIKPVSKNAKYTSICLNCEELLFRVHIGAGKSALRHVFVDENGKVVGHNISDHCNLEDEEDD